MNTDNNKTETKQCTIYSVSESFSKIELAQHIAELEYQLSEINEHGLGDSDTVLTKWTIERDLKIFKTDLNSR